MALRTLSRGAGPTLVLVHGSAADASTWTIQLASLAREFRLVAVEREMRDEVRDAAADLVEVIDACADAPVVAVGSSFGAVIVLEVARSAPERLRGMVLCEPPLPPTDYAPGVPLAFGCEFDRLAYTAGGEAAGEFFLRTVLTDAAYEALPVRWQRRACALWREIRADSGALARYRPRYAELADVRVPALLLGGERSSGFYRPTLHALAAALPDARLELLRGAGHMMHADAHRGFNAAVSAFFAGLR